MQQLISIIMLNYTLTIWHCFVQEGEFTCHIDGYTEQQLHIQNIAFADNSLEAVISTVSTWPQVVTRCISVLVHVNTVIFRALCTIVNDALLCNVEGWYAKICCS